MQEAFDNIVAQWADDVEMVIYVNPGATPEQIASSRPSSTSYPQIDQWTYCATDCELVRGQRLLAGDPSTLNS